MPDLNPGSSCPGPAGQAREAVTPGMVAARPRLGAALIRVYGEVGDLAALLARSREAPAPTRPLGRSSS